MPCPLAGRNNRGVVPNPRSVERMVRRYEIPGFRSSAPDYAESLERGKAQLPFFGRTSMV